MARYAALLRGITPSNPNMTNDKVRGVFTALGFGAVASVLASGNIVFDSLEADVPAMEQRIEEALTANLGIDATTIIRTHSELRTLWRSDPFPGLKHGRGTYLIATFLKDRAAAPEDLPDQPDPRIRVVGYDAPARALLAIIDNSDPGKTPDFMAWLEKTYGKAITTRTWLTVQRIITKLEV